MLTIKQNIAERLSSGIRNMGVTEAPDAAELAAMLEYPPDPAMGDLALPCFRLSRTLRRAPVQIAASLVGCLAGLDCVAHAEAVNGYLNITVSNEYLTGRVLTDILEKGDRYGACEQGKGKTVVLDYSSPNVAKPFHIGHLGTTVIGHSLKKLHEFCGYTCVGINYLGDWGTQFGKLIVAYRKWGNREMIERGGIDKLVELYVRFHAEAETNKALEDEARAEFHKLEQGDADNTALWRWFVDISLVEYQETYKQLGITFDSYKGESFYTDKMPAEVEKLRQKGLLQIDDGASIVYLAAYGMPPCLILKRDGSTLYPTRDIAAAVYRQNTYHFDKAVYVTSAAQSLHFAQWFKVVELMGYDWYDKLVHVPYGTVSIGGTKLATRTGNVVLLRDLFRAAVDEVRAIMKEKNTDAAEDESIAEAVGVGAIVFYYLSNNRIKDINFVMEDALNFDGNTGPYVQYTYARTCAVLRKCTGTPGGALRVTAPEEATLIKVLARFPECVQTALSDYEPSVVTRYILDVATAFNRFYHNCQILCGEGDVTATRVAITKAVNTVLANALPLICMKAMEKI